MFRASLAAVFLGAVPGEGFTYEDPSQWASSPGNDQCGGKFQSPINLETSIAMGGESFFHEVKLHLAKPHLRPGMVVVNTGHMIQVTAPLGSLTLPDGGYNIEQFRLHTPSEHTLGNKHAEGELHIVSVREDSKHFAVIAFLLELGRDDFISINQLLPGDGSELPTTPHTNASLHKPLSLRPLSSALAGPYYHYVGSHTTPPCHETVHWYVMQTKLGISNDFLQALKQAVPGAGNNRPVQPLNGRDVVEGVELPGEFDPTSKLRKQWGLSVLKSPCDIQGHYELEGCKGCKNDWHHVEITKAGTGQFKWTNRAGVSWTLYSADPCTESVVVGKDCPFYQQGFTRMEVAADSAGAVAYVEGPWQEHYLRVDDPVDRERKLELPQSGGTGAVEQERKLELQQRLGSRAASGGVRGATAALDASARKKTPAELQAAAQASSSSVRFPKGEEPILHE